MFTKSSKVKFQDQQLDDYVLENSVLKSKLQSKIEALSIMSNELDKCGMERDRFKVLVEQLKCKKKAPYSYEETNVNAYRFSHNNGLSGGDLLANTREQNNTLKLEVETLRGKLEEATGDNVALRKQLQLAERCPCHQNSLVVSRTNNDYEELVQQLEKTHKKYQQLQLDYRATLDEREELVADRDYYKTKVQRLNHQVSYILSSRSKVQPEVKGDPPKPIVDIDGLVTENKYLQDRITQLQLEKEILKRTLTKYKTLLENRHKSDSLNLKKGFIDVMTQKQVREYLDINSKTGLKRTSATELKSLCLGLFEALNDKSIALQHQRKTNQILANRITELEKTLESWCNGQKYIPIFPSQMLLDEFFPENGLKSDDSKENYERTKDYDRNSEKVNKIKYSESVDEDGKTVSEESSDENKSNDSAAFENGGLGTKTVLPYELEELVKEALASLKPTE